MSVSFPVSFIILKRIVRRIYIELIVKVSGEDTPYLSVFSPNAGKYGLEKAPYLDTFHAVLVQVIT